METQDSGSSKTIVEATPSVVGESEIQLNDGIATASSGSSYELYDGSIVPDGIYAFQNLGNSDRWLDI